VTRLGQADAGPRGDYRSMDLGDGHPLSIDQASDRRRFRIAHALRSVEDALLLLNPLPAEGIEVGALRRVRDDLSVLLRATAREHR
jgi:hypothetical protein